MLETPICAVCGKDCTGRFWMQMMSGSDKVIYYLYYDTQECVDASVDLLRDSLA